MGYKEGSVPFVSPSLSFFLSSLFFLFLFLHSFKVFSSQSLECEDAEKLILKAFSHTCLHLILPVLLIRQKVAPCFSNMAYEESSWHSLSLPKRNDDEIGAQVSGPSTLLLLNV